MNERTIETVERLGDAALPDSPVHSRKAWLAIVFLGSGVLVTFLWIVILVYGLIVLLF